jgi:hypothetical protein
MIWTSLPRKTSPNLWYPTTMLPQRAGASIISDLRLVRCPSQIASNSTERPHHTYRWSMPQVMVSLLACPLVVGHQPCHRLHRPRRWQSALRPSGATKVLCQHQLQWTANARGLLDPPLLARHRHRRLVRSPVQAGGLGPARSPVHPGQISLMKRRPSCLHFHQWRHSPGMTLWHENPR